MSQHHNHIIIW